MEEKNYRKISKYSSSGITTELLVEHSNESAHNLLCNICLQILFKPVQCKNCKKEYCSFCLLEWYKINNKCPICKQNEIEEIDTNVLERLNELDFKCLYNTNKCNKVMKYNDFIEHLELCEFADYESTLIQCKFKGTLEEVKKHTQNCNCEKSLNKNKQLIKDFYNGLLFDIHYSWQKNSYNCINSLIYIEEYDYLVVGNSKGELVIFNTDYNTKLYEKKGFKYISLVYYFKKKNILLVGTINGGLYGLSMSDMRDLFYIKTGHLFIEFLAELYYPLLAVSDREDFLTIINHQDNEIKNVIKTEEKINKIISWEEKKLLFTGSSSGSINVFNYIDFSIVYQKENAHLPNKFLHCLELDKINNSIISGGYDGYIRKWKIEQDNLIIKLSLLYQISTNLNIITGILLNLESNFLYYLKMDNKIHKVNYDNGEKISSKTILGSKALCGIVRLPESCLLIIGDYKLPKLNVIDCMKNYD